MHHLVNKPASLTEIKDFLSQPRVTVRPRLWLQRIDIRLGEQTKFRYANQRFVASLMAREPDLCRRISGNKSVRIGYAKLRPSRGLTV